MIFSDRRSGICCPKEAYRLLTIDGTPVSVALSHMHDGSEEQILGLRSCPRSV